MKELYKLDELDSSIGSIISSTENEESEIENNEIENNKIENNKIADNCCKPILFKCRFCHEGNTYSVYKKF